MNITYSAPVRFLDPDLAALDFEALQLGHSLPAFGPMLKSKHGRARMHLPRLVGGLPEELDGVRLAELGSASGLKVLARGAERDVSSEEESLSLPVSLDLVLELLVVGHSA